MDKSGPWLLMVAIGVFGVAAVLAYSLIAPTWDQGETSALLGGLMACPTLGLAIGVTFLGLHWRDERTAARDEKRAARYDRDTASRQRGIDRLGQDVTVSGMNAAMLSQVVGLLGDVAQVQQRQASAGLAEARRDAFQQKAIDVPAQQEESWFTGNWSYDDETAENDEAGGRIAFL